MGEPLSSEREGKGPVVATLMSVREEMEDTVSLCDRDIGGMDEVLLSVASLNLSGILLLPRLPENDAAVENSTLSVLTDLDGLPALFSAEPLIVGDTLPILVDTALVEAALPPVRVRADGDLPELAVPELGLPVLGETCTAPLVSGPVGMIESGRLLLADSSLTDERGEENVLLPRLEG